MSMYYSHLLVPLSPGMVFAPSAVAAFLEAAANEGFVGKNAERFVRMDPDPTGFFVFSMQRGMRKSGTSRGKNPSSWVCPDSEQELLAAVEKGGNVQATIWSEQRPLHPPLLELEALQGGKPFAMSDAQFDEVYYVALTCHRTEVLVSMSDDGHYEASTCELGDPVNASDPPSLAVANYPNKPGRMEIAGIGSARSWVSITFGNYVFPPARLFDRLFSKDDGLPFVTPAFLELAERMLDCKLRQSCAWG